MLQDRAMLANLTIRAWTNRKQDKKVSAEVEIQHGAKNAGNFNKQLIDKSALDPLTTHAGRVRDYHYSMTLPWSDSGDRLLPAKAYFDYTTAMRKFRDEAEKLADDLANEYPLYVAAARQRLGTMYDANDYPAADDIRKRFAIELSFLPVPDAEDFRVDIGAQAVEEIRKSITKNVNERQIEAVKECWNRLYEVIVKIEIMLLKEKPIFRDSLIDNARDLIELLPKLNITDDKDLVDVCNQVNDELLVSPSRLRMSGKLRKEVADKASAIVQRISEHR